MAEHGTFVWNHLVTSDQEKCGKFYCDLLGWSRREVDAGPMGVYTVFQRGSADVAGMMNPTIEYTRSRPPNWYAYVAVDDVDACADRTPLIGGQILVPPHDIPGVGRACLIADPSGAVVTLMTPANRP